MDALKVIFDRIADNIVPIHPDGWKFVAGAFGGALLLLLFSTSLGLITLFISFWTLAMFRDPERVVPQREGLIVAPCDGRIEAIETVIPNGEFDLGPGDFTCISVHLSLFDVHVNRTPVSGQVLKRLYIPGVFSDPRRHKASLDNERLAFVVGTNSDDRVGVVLIAGGLRRRIVSGVREGDRIGIGTRIGLIRFGSRVDLYLPKEYGFLVAPGQTMIAGETIIADTKSTEQERSARLI